MDKQLDYMPLQEKLKSCEVESLLVALRYRYWPGVKCLSLQYDMCTKILQIQ